MERENEDFFYGQDGDQITCYRGDFTNLAECCCGFGCTAEEAKSDLLRQENIMDKRIEEAIDAEKYLDRAIVEFDCSPITPEIERKRILYLKELVQAVKEGRLGYYVNDPCDVCWTSSRAPCHKDTPDARQVKGKDE